MKYILIGALALGLAACGEATPLQRAETGSTEVVAGLLAVVDGCKIWHVKALGHNSVYFAKCPKSDMVADTNWEHRYQCGKQTCSTPMSAIGPSN